MASNILVATDGSQHGDRAVDCAAEFANKLGRDLHIVHVLMHGRTSKELKHFADIEHASGGGTAGVPDVSQYPAGTLSAFMRGPEDDVSDARVTAIIGEHVIAQAADRARAAGAKNLSTHLASGDFADKILDTAEAERAGMIVLGRRGLGRLRETVLGSVSQKVLHHAPCTIVIAQ